MGFFTTWVVLMFTTADVSVLATATQGVELAAVELPARAGGFSVQRGGTAADEPPRANRSVPAVSRTTPVKTIQGLNKRCVRMVTPPSSGCVAPGLPRAGSAVHVIERRVAEEDREPSTEPGRVVVRHKQCEDLAFNL